MRSGTRFRVLKFEVFVLRTEFAKQLHEYGIRLHEDTMPPGGIDLFKLLPADIAGVRIGN